MRPATAAALTLYTVALGWLAYTLCFTVTTLGGWLPAAVITLSPALFLALGLIQREG